MEYRFGPNKPIFTGTDSEWNKLKGKIAWWNEDTSNYPIVTVICPHCGVKNTHIADGVIIGDDDHKKCGSTLDKKGKAIFYTCPGYVICRYINTPK
jgi:hypothetical protein